MSNYTYRKGHITVDPAINTHEMLQIMLLEPATIDKDCTCVEMSSLKIVRGFGNVYNQIQGIDTGYHYHSILAQIYSILSENPGRTFQGWIEYSAEYNNYNRIGIHEGKVVDESGTVTVHYETQDGE